MRIRVGITYKRENMNYKNLAVAFMLLATISTQAQSKYPEGVTFFQHFGGGGTAITLKEGTYYMDQTTLKNAVSGYSINGSYSMTFWGSKESDVATVIHPFSVGHTAGGKVSNFEGNYLKFNDKVNKVTIKKYEIKK